MKIEIKFTIYAIKFFENVIVSCFIFILPSFPLSFQSIFSFIIMKPHSIKLSSPFNHFI